MNCPFMSRPIESKHHGHEVVRVKCDKEDCQIFIQGNCIFVDINRSLTDLAVAVEGLYLLLKGTDTIRRDHG